MRKEDLIVVPEDLKGIYERCAPEHIPIATPEMARFLYTMVTMLKPKRILEIGTCIGYSARWMSKAIGKEGQILTVEIDKEMAKQARENFSKGDYQNITLIEEDAKIVLYDLVRKKEKFDFIFNDGPKGQYLTYLPYFEELLNEKGVLICDNMFFKDYIFTEEDPPPRKHRTIIRNMTDFIHKISYHEDFTTTFLDISDGVSISYKGGSKK